MKDKQHENEGASANSKVLPSAGARLSTTSHALADIDHHVVAAKAGPSWRRRALQRQQYLSHSILGRPVDPNRPPTPLEGPSVPRSCEVNPKRHLIAPSQSSFEAEVNLSFDILPSPTTSLSAVASPSQSTLYLPSASASPANNFYSTQSPSPRISSFTLDSHRGDSTSWLSEFSSCADTSPTMSLFVPLNSNVNAANVMAPKAIQQLPPRKAHKPSPPKKGKVFDGMLSALSRKRQKALPRAESRVSETEASTIDRLDSTASDSTHTALTSPNISLDSVHAKSPKKSNKLQPRSGRIELSENHKALRKFLDDSRVSPRGSSTAIEPKSAFDWDSDDEHPSAKPSRSSTFPRFRKFSKASVAEADISGVIQAHQLEDEIKRIAALTEHLAPQNYNGSPNAFKDQQDALDEPGRGVATGGGKIQKTLDHVTHKNPVQVTTFSRESGLAKRSSVLRLFNDPIWGRGDESVSGFDFKEKEFSGVSPQAPHTLRYASPTSIRPTVLSTSTSMPSLTTPPHQYPGEVSCDDINISPSKVHNKMGDASAVLGCSAFASHRPGPTVASQRKGSYTAKPPPLLRRKVKSQLTIDTKSSSKKKLTKAAPPPPPYQQFVGGAAIHDLCRSPQIPSPLRNGTEGHTASGQATQDPFFDHTPMLTQSGAGWLSETSTLVSPSQRQSAATSRTVTDSSIWTVVAPHHAVTPGKDFSPSPSASIKSSESAEQKLLGLFTERPAQDVATAADSDHNAKKGRAAKVRAARDVFLLASELDLTPRKPLQELTRQDLEVVGQAVTSLPEHDSVVKTSSLLGRFFRRAQGTKLELELQGEELRSRLQAHPSLQSLTELDATNVESPTGEQQARWGEALEYLAVSEDDGRAHVRSDTAKMQDAYITIGLGISANPSSPIRERNPTPMDFGLLRPMSTIKEAKTERSSYVHDADDEDTQSETSNYSVEQTEQTWECHQPQEPGGDEGSSGYSCEEAVPEPLQLPKRLRPPLELSMIKVSSSKTSPTDEGSFSPRRTSSFMRHIKEVSRLKQIKLDSHPALRDSSPDSLDMSPHSPSSYHISRPQAARVDSGIEMEVSELFDEGYATTGIDRCDFLRRRPSQSGRNDSPTFGHQRTQSAHSRKLSNDSGGRLSGDVDMQRLRESMEMDLLTLPTGPDALRHPHHPFTWNHQKIMCRSVHNERNEQPTLPDVPTNSPTSLRHMESSYFKDGNPIKGEAENVQRCPSCEKQCCRYAELLVESNTTSQDLTESAMRLKASNRVSLLRSSHPEGIEWYETFVVCGQCGVKVCPDCSTRCAESLCQGIFCSSCSPGLMQCPVHNFF